MEWTGTETDATGQTITYTNHYTEVASGLHYRDANGQWQETVAEFVPVTDGFVAARGPHQVALASDISTPNAVTLVTPEGRTLHSAPLLLAYVDYATGESLRLADLKSAVGTLVAPNVVLYADAFDTLTADVRVTYTVGGLECDVILRQQLPDPALLGLDPDTTEMAVYSEWPDAQPDRAEAHEVPLGSVTLTDTALSFDSLAMPRGRAFGLDEQVRAQGIDVPVRKTWLEIDGRPCLIERASYRALQPLLGDLPGADAPTPEQRRRLHKLGANAQLKLPALRSRGPAWSHDDHGRLLVHQGAKSDGKVAELAFSAPALPSARRGLVLDYTVVNTITNWTFDGLTTYYVSGPVTLSSNVTFQAGTVIKFAATNTPGLTIHSGATLSWLGAPYRPVTLTGKDDTASGEPLPGASGTLSGSYGQPALKLDNLGVVTLTNLCIRNADIAIQAIGTSRPTVRHGQFVSCATGVKTDFNTTLQNVLFDNVENVVWTTGIYDSTGEFLTLDSASYANYSPGGGKLTLTSSLLVSVANTNGCALGLSSYMPLTAGLPVFKSAVAGSHYLDPQSPSINSLSANSYISAVWAADAAFQTVDAPELLNSSTGTNRLLDPHAFKDVDQLYIGYHYWVLDFIAKECGITNATLVLTNGTVLGFSGTNGFVLASGGRFVSQGQPNALNRLGWVSAVQERATGGSTGSSRRMFYLTNSSSTRPDLILRLTKAEFAADVPDRRLLLDDGSNFLNAFTLRDSQLFGAKVQMTPSLTPGPTVTVGFTNNVIDTCVLNINHYYDEHLDVALFNNLFINGTLALAYISNTYNPVWTAKDNLFVGASGSGGSFLQAGNNGYSGSTAFLGGTGNKTNLVSIGTGGFTNGPLGSYYYPSTGGSTSLYALVEAGSRTADNAALYHYTTQVSQVKEANSTVDIGFHYVATTNSTSTVCIDSDSDTLPDYLEDTNGDGSAQASEFSWRAADTDGDGLNDASEWDGTIADGQVVSWGDVSGVPDSVADLPASTAYIAVSAGNSFSVALKQFGDVFAWGLNTYGQTNVPTAATNAVAVSAGDRHALALNEAGVIFAWGDNTYGQTSLPIPNTNFTAIATHYRHSLALRSDGTVVAWGDNTYGQTNVPAGLTNVNYISAGQWHSLALKSDGTVKAWGNNTYAQTNIPVTATNIIEIAAGYTHSLALRADGTVIAWGDNTGGATNVPSGLTNALHVAAGNHFSVVLKNDYTLVAWGDNTYGQTGTPDTLTNVQSIAAGYQHAIALPYCPVLEYPVDPRRDVLVIYNSNYTDSRVMKDYYLAQRPRLTGVTALGIGLDSTLQEICSGSSYSSTFYPTVSNWFKVNPTLRPAFVTLMYGVPNIPSASYAGISQGGSLQNDLRHTLGTNFGRLPWIGALNFYGTNDCKHYIDKLATIGSATPLNCVALSADKAGIYRDTYVVDGTPHSIPTDTVSKSRSSLITYGISLGNILYSTGSSPQIQAATNVLNWLSWGCYNYLGYDWATNGQVKLYGNSSWYVTEAIESFNGLWFPSNAPFYSPQHSYRDWFSQYAMGGTNWDMTPVGATSTVNEPTDAGMAQPAIWLPLWAFGHSLSKCIWLSQPITTPLMGYSSIYVQVTGDPLVRR